MCGREGIDPKQKEQARGCRGGDEARPEGIETCRTTESGFGVLKVGERAEALDCESPLGFSVSISEATDRRRLWRPSAVFHTWATFVEVIALR